MKPDLYTKSVLTVIALSLLVLCAQNTFHPTAVLAQGTQRVIIVGYEGDNYGLPVAIRSIQNQMTPGLPVTIKAIDLPSTPGAFGGGPLPVNIMATPQSNPVPVPVNIVRTSLGPYGVNVIPITGTVRIDSTGGSIPVVGSVSIDGPVTVRQVVPKAAPPVPTKK